MNLNSLEAVREALIATTAHDWPTDLPTFGGTEPDDTRGVWSWDARRLLVGTCSDDLEIVPREIVRPASFGTLESVPTSWERPICAHCSYGVRSRFSRAGLPFCDAECARAFDAQAKGVE